VLYGIGFSIFYIKYVPLVRPFQMALIPVLILAFVLSALREEWGLLFFVFSFPLINNLPHFFGLSESVPHAPTALVLFLAFFLGWLVRLTVHKTDFLLDLMILKPIALFSVLIAASAAITFLKYSNFFPFLESRIYEILTNSIGVSAGGALMSVIFFALNYLTGLAFFFILVSTPRSKPVLDRILSTFCLSVLISLCFALYQHLANLEFGNNPKSISEGMINGTFKDALSFGAFISIMTPLALAAFFYFRWRGKVLASAILGLSAYLIFFAGSKSGLIALICSLTVLAILALVRTVRLIRARKVRVKKALSFAAAFVLIIMAVTGALLALKVDIRKAVTAKRLNIYVKYGLSGLSPYGRTLRDNNWKVASYMIRDYPLSGVGIGGYIIEAPTYSREHKTNIIVAESAENYFLQIGSELGIIGLLLVFWISWELARQAWLTYKRMSDNDRHIYILMGVIAGIIAYLVNLQAHTYIGSYEIKYTFWLLAGMIFCLGRMAEAENKAISFGKSFKVISLVLILLYSGVHLWNSTHSLSLKTRIEQIGLKQDFGFYQPEKTNDGRPFRWSGKNAGLTRTIDKPVLEILLLASHPDILQNPVRLKVFIVKDLFKKKKLLGEIFLTRNIWQTHELDVSKDVGQEVILLFEVSRTWNPRKALGTPDPRNLGIALGGIRFREK